MASQGRVAVATIPANTRGSNPRLIGRGWRDLDTGSLVVEVPNYASYRPPAGWSITGVFAGDGAAKVYVEREGDA